MSVDVVCTGAVFLDLTFEGLEELPAPGRERMAHELQSPGGAAITAIGLVRLGLTAAVVAPLGVDAAGLELRRLLDRAGVRCEGAETDRTPVTVVLPMDGERAMVTFQPPTEVDLAAVERLEPRAVVTGAERIDLVPDGIAGYAMVGDPESERLALKLPSNLGRVRALLANRSEALQLTGESGPEAAALALAEHVETVVVSCGAYGAVAASNGQIFSASAPAVEARDTTGAGDLLAAAYVHGDLSGLPLVERLQRAVVYSALSVRAATGAMSAATLDELERALVELNPANVQTASAKERS